MELLYITGEKLITKKEKIGNNTVLISCELGEEQKHYVYIQNFNRLMFNFSNHKDTKHFCMRCLHCFSSE